MLCLSCMANRLGRPPRNFTGAVCRDTFSSESSITSTRTLATDISLNQLATVAGMSTHYFAELFRQSTGHPPDRYLLLRTIERAKQSLRYARCSLVEAALESGFHNPSHFARTFRRFVGVSPSQFRSEGY